MCGIIGILGTGDVAGSVVEGLRRLEYRGYDSAGVATLANGHIDRRRAEGKLNNLAKALQQSPLPGDVGIGHTRWATHGGPSVANAHPHATEMVAVVHNGIIENYKALRDELTAEGAVFESETDTETVAHLITKYRREGMSPADAASAAFKRLKGAFALAIIFAGDHDLLIGARRGSPLAVGYGDDGTMYLASDAIALAPFTHRLTYLNEGDWVELKRDRVIFHDEADRLVNREIRVSHASAMVTGKGDYQHYMQKEIHEQPTVIADTLHAFLHPSTGEIALPKFDVDLALVPKITIVACGTASYAGLTAKYWIEQLARLSVEVDIASEFRYRQAPMPKDGIALFVSQSGETADTLEALRYARREGQHILSVINVPESTIARESDAVMYTHAGPEIGVASTKAFTTQLTVLASFAVALAKARGTISESRDRDLAAQLGSIPTIVNEILKKEKAIATLAKSIMGARDVLYLGRGGMFPIALEGALKLKEISYIHAEGYAAGEMKHGPIALVDEHVPIIVLAPHDALFEKTASNVQEVAARGGKVLLMSDARGLAELKDCATWTLEMPEVPPFVAPIAYSIPIQLLAYHVAVAKGTDVDQPRNLAKSVTVE
jgi:glucosamine--fructose-6-phosphate aminotransferase (isomerizing)